MTYDEFVRLALALPETEESLYYGSPAVKRSGRAMFSGNPESGIVSLKMDWNTIDEVTEEKPEVFYQSDHQSTWPWVSVRLEVLTIEDAKRILRICWEDAPKPGRRRKTG